MRAPVGFTYAAKSRVIDWLKANVKDRYVETVDLNSTEWLSEVYDRVSDRVEGKHEPDYELSQANSKSGSPELLSFSADDFLWSDDGE